MSEAQVGFLYKVASSLQHVSNQNVTMLRSYYLMRCNEITKGYGLPDKHFSSKVRCTRCCVEWRKGTQTRINPVKLSKKQRQRIRRKKVTQGNKELLQKNKELLHSNKMEQICSFCKTISTTIVPRLAKKDIIDSKNIKTVKNNETKTTISKPETLQTQSKEIQKPNNKKSKEINVYNQTEDVFSLKNSKNTIASVVKEPAKVIKNNKKRKDKYAGLCQKAVLASAKLQQDAKDKNKLNMFLKPSS